MIVLRPFNRRATPLAILILISIVPAAFPSNSPSETLVDQASAGSAAAAKKLILLNKDNENAIRYWRTVAAENGDVIEQYNLWFDLSKESNPLLQKRALYWLKKAADGGDVMAKERLAELRR